MADNSFSLDIQDKYVRICDSKQSGQKIELLSLGVKEGAPFYFSNDNKQAIERQAEILADLVSSLKIKKRIVNVTIPDTYIYTQIIQMPMLKEKELISAIRYQSDEFIPMPIDETNLDIQILEENLAKKQILVLIAAAPKKLVTQVEKTIELAGFVPGNLQNELAVVGRLFSEKLNVNQKQNPTLIINFGFSSSSLYVLDERSHLIIYVRTFKNGIELFLKDLKVNLNIDDNKGLEILKSIGFSKDGSVNTEAILNPVLNEFVAEIEKVVAITRDKFNLQIDQSIIFNYDNAVLHLVEKITERTKFPCSSLNLSTLLVANPVYQSFSANMSSYVSVIAGSL